MNANNKKLTLKWESDKDMRALFSNFNNEDKNEFSLLMVFHKSKKGGFSREISLDECESILRKENKSYFIKN